jgi:hypothetical protein
MLPDGRDLADLASTPTPDGDTTWERYVLGRMGVLTPTPIPLLDGVELFEIIQAASVIAISTLDREAQTTSMRINFTQRTEAVPLGFGVLCGGAEAIDEHFRRYLGLEGRLQHEPRLVFGMEGLFGPLHGALRHLSDNRLRPVLFRSMCRIARELGIYSRKGTLTLRRGPTDPVTLREVTARLGLNEPAVRRIAVKLGLTRREMSRGECHSFAPSAVQQIAELVADLVSRHEAADLLGVTLRELKVLYEEGLIAPFIKLRGGSVGCDKYRRSEIEALLLTKDDAWSQSRLKRKAIERRRSLRMARTSASPAPSRPGVTFTLAAAQIGIDLGTVRALVLDGRLKLVPEANNRGRPRLCEQSVLWFSDRFAPARVYAGVLGCQSHLVARRLKTMGVDPLPLPGGPLRDVLVSRGAARLALGLQADPGVDELAPEAQFWRSLADNLLATHSRVRVVRTDGREALVAFGNLLRARLTLASTKLTIEVRGDPSISCRTHRALNAMASPQEGGRLGSAIRRESTSGALLLGEVFDGGRAVVLADVPKASEWVGGVLGAVARVCLRLERTRAMATID